MKMRIDTGIEYQNINFPIFTTDILNQTFTGGLLIQIGNIEINFSLMITLTYFPSLFQSLFVTGCQY